MKKKNILFYIMILFIILTSVSIHSVNVHAQTNVTKKISSTQKKKMKTIANKFTNMSGYYLEYVNTKAGASKTFDFNKKSYRQYFIKYSDNFQIKSSASKQNSYSKQIFGKSVSKVSVVIGDWGCQYPVCSMSQIYKLSSSKYKLFCKLYMVDDSTETVTKSLIGTEIFYLTKSSKAKYGYYVTKLVLKDSGIVGKWYNPSASYVYNTTYITFSESNTVTINSPREWLYGTYSKKGNKITIKLTKEKYYSNVTCKWYTNSSYRQNRTGTLSGKTFSITLDNGYGTFSFNLKKL